MTDFRPHSVEWTDEKVTRFWDYLGANHAGEFFSEKHAPDIAERLINAARPASVIDIGCGTGPLVEELVRRGVRASGLDSSPAVLEAARSRTPNASFYLGTVESIPLPDESFDAATLIEVIEHLDDQRLTAAMTEARRILRIGGTLMITTPNAEDLTASSRQCPDCGAEFHTYQHVRSWTSDALTRFLRSSGFATAVRGIRFVERAPLMERVIRRAYYTARGQRPRLIAIATKS